MTTALATKAKPFVLELTVWTVDGGSDHTHLDCCRLTYEAQGEKRVTQHTLAENEIPNLCGRCRARDNPYIE